MAKLPAIIELISQHDTRTLATITNYARVLRDAGVLPKGKRGRGAPEMHQTEVADLVIGLAGASDAVDAPYAVRILKNAKLYPQAELQGEGAVDAQAELKRWSISEQCEDFGFLLASLLVDEPGRHDAQIDDDGNVTGLTRMTVTINEVIPSIPVGTAEVFLDDGKQWVKLFFETPELPSEDAHLEGRVWSGNNATWSRSTSIDHSFFVSMSVCINGGYRGDIE